MISPNLLFTVTPRRVNIYSKNDPVHLRSVDSIENSRVSWLGVRAGVEQQGVSLRPPGIVVLDTPDSDTDAVALSHASLDNVGPIRLLRVLDVHLGECAFGGGAAEGSHGGGSIGALAGAQVSLGTDAIDGDTGRDPLLDVADHALGFGVAGLVEAIWWSAF